MHYDYNNRTKGGAIMYDVTIIGAGIIGTFIARELARYTLRIALLEKDNDVANGTTKANSAIIHAGYDAKSGTLKAKFNALGNPMFDKVCEELDVPFKRIGSLVLAFSEDQMETLGELYEQGRQNKIPDLRILNRDEVKAIEPNISEYVVGALHAPTAGIVGPWELAMALAENAVDNNVDLMLNNEVIKIEKQEDSYVIFTNEQQIKTKYVINCAGVYADNLHNMVAKPSFEIIPRRGQYFVLDKSEGNITNSILFQCPTKLGKGVLVLPTVHENILIGPDAEDIENKENTETTEERLCYVMEASRKTLSNVPFNSVITSFAGLRAKPSTEDFIIEESNQSKGFINVAGIESPGLSAAPAIAEYVVNMLRDMDGSFKLNEEFNPIRRKMTVFMALNEEEKKEIIKKDPRYGRVICRCENITEGEIVDSINRNAGARTFDGVKRRVRPGMGRCQGGFCGPRVMEILARELGEDIVDIVKDSKKSYIATGLTKNNV